MLGGVPVQHRETQEFETSQFLSYFKGGWLFKVKLFEIFCVILI